MVRNYFFLEKLFYCCSLDVFLCFVFFFSNCCRFDNTVRDTTIDALSIRVHQVHKTKLKQIWIPPSPCCPACWIFKCCPFSFCVCRGICSCCFVSTTEIVNQEIFHKTAGRVSSVNSMPNSSCDSLFKMWLFCGLCGGHRFKSRHNTYGKLFLVLW